MTLWHDSYARESADGASHARDGSKHPRDDSRSTNRWPASRALLFMVVVNLVLWALIIAGLSLLF